MRRALLALATVALLGCPGDSSNSSGTSYVGTYTLISAGGATLPAASGTSGQTITAGTLTLTSGGSFTYNETRSPSGSQSSTGTYTISGVNITFTQAQTQGQSDGGATGTFNSATSLTVTPTGEPILVFTKQ